MNSIVNYLEKKVITIMNQERNLVVMNFIKKKYYFLILSLSVGVLLLGGCTQKKEEKQVKELCQILFDFPNENSEKILNEIQTSTVGSIMGMGTESIENAEEESLKVALHEVYGKYFTEVGLENFYNNRTFIDILLMLQAGECKMIFENVKQVKSSTEHDNTETYEAELKVNDDKIEQEILVTFKDDKIDYFALSDNKIVEAITSNSIKE